MNKNDFIFKYLSNIYVKLKQKKMNSFDLKIQNLKKEIENEKKILEKKQKYINELSKNNDELKNRYNDLFKLFKSNRKILKIKNNNYNISTWENVFIIKKSFKFIIQTKQGEDIYVFDRNLKDFLEYFITLNYSIVVLHVDKDTIVLDFRVN